MWVGNWLLKSLACVNSVWAHGWVATCGTWALACVNASDAATVQWCAAGWNSDHLVEIQFTTEGWWSDRDSLQADGQRGHLWNWGLKQVVPGYLKRHVKFKWSSLANFRVVLLMQWVLPIETSSVCLAVRDTPVLVSCGRWGIPLREIYRHGLTWIWQKQSTLDISRSVALKV